MNDLSNDNLLDLNLLTELREVMGADFSLLLATFIEDSQTKVALIQQAMAMANLEAVRRLAHSLKGSSLNMGAIEIAKLCQVIETDASQGKLESLEEYYLSLNERLKRSCAALKEL